MLLVCSHLWLLLLLLIQPDDTLSAETDAGELQQMYSDGPRTGREAPLCHLSEKELHTTVRSAALSALKGTCDPAELEERLVAMETRLSQQLEEMKASLSRLVLESVVYDYEDEDEEDGESAGNREQHRYSGGASASDRTNVGASDTSRGDSDREESGQAQLTHYNEFRDERRRTAYKRYGSAPAQTAATAQANSSSSSEHQQHQQQQRTRVANAHNKQDGRDAASGVRLDFSRTRPADRRSGGRGGSRRGRTSYLTAAGEHRYHNANSYQYAAAQNSSASVSGTRQISAASLRSRSDAAAAAGRGNVVRYSTSYTPTKTIDPYTTFGGAGSGSTSFKGRRQSRHKQTRRRGQHVTDTVSYVTGAGSSQRSRLPEIGLYNDTVYELNDKRMYSYYWQVKDFDTMMNTWENRHSLRSPSFYVYQGGYRMYLRVFPSRQGGNVYMHAGLTPGRYDAQLSWPFQLRLRMSLLDHSATPHNIASRVWQPRNLCSGWNWRRPRGKDNFECVGLGFPQQLLRTRRFLLDGAVLIKLDVILEE